MAQKAEGAGILERGNIYFLYRPKAQQERARKKADVERFYMVLSPAGRKLFREIVIGQKELPKVAPRERNWGFVKMVVQDPKELEADLGEITYPTKTRGERTVAAARPAGEGVYATVRHDNHTHLAYSLELPEKPKAVQREFRIADQASYIISVKNPGTSSPPQVGLRGEQKADYPHRLQEVFRDRRFADADQPELLDYEGAEIMLIGARENPSEEGVRLKPERETGSSADIFRELKLYRKKHPLSPLFEGRELV